MRKPTRQFAALVALLLAMLPLSVLAADWFQFGYDAQHSNVNPNETAITASNVGSLKKLFQINLANDADGAPVYLSGVSINNTLVNLLFVTNKNGQITAFDANTGAQVWAKQPFNGTCTSTDSNRPCYTTSSPVIDPNRQYVYSYSFDGKVHKYAVADGSEVTSGGWPEVITLKPSQEKASSALTTATINNITYLYAPIAGYNGDAGDYQGHLTTINLNDGTQTVFNADCSNLTVHFSTTSPDCSQKQTAIWGRSGVVYDAATNRIYTATGNGTFNPSAFNWGDTVLALNPNGTGKGDGNPVDSYTPTNFQSLQDNDTDIGSTVPAILPTAGYAGIKYPHLGLQGGKDANLRLINLDNLSNTNPAGTGHTGGEIGIVAVPQGGGVFTEPAVWIDAQQKTWIFLTTSRGISAMQLTVDGNGNPGLQTVWKDTTLGGSSPIVVNNLLYYAGNNNIRVLNPVSGTQLWSSTQSNVQIGSIHWESPIVANGVLYISDGAKYDTGGNLTAYSLNGATPTPTPSPTPTTPGSTPTPTPTPPPANARTYPIPFVANAANGFTTFLSVQNVGKNPASISIQYYASNGGLLSTDANAALNSYTLWNPVTKLGVGQSGTAIVTSNQPLNIVVAEATPYGASAYVLPGAVGSSLISPLALNGAYGFNTRLTVFNTGTNSSNVTVQFYSNTGSHLSNADQTFNLASHTANSIDETAIGLPAQFNGWALVTGDTGAALTAQTLEQNSATRFVAIIGSATPTTSLFDPAVFNGAFGNFITGGNLVNPNATSVTVTITYHDAAGNPTTTTPFSIPAFGSQAIYHAATSGNGLPVGGLPAHFAGTASIQATANLLMVVNEDGGTTASGSRESGVYIAPGAGGNTLGLPVMSNGYIGFYTGASILNVSNSPVTVSVQYYDTNGNAVGGPRSQTIAANGTYFVYQGGENPALPGNFYGSAIINVAGAANSIVAITNANSSQFFYSYAEQQNS